MQTTQWNPRLCRLFIGLLTSCTAQAGDLNVMVTNEKGRPLEDAVVYVESDNSQSADREAEVKIIQDNRNFAPKVSVIQKGTLVNFPNQDSIQHHVYSFSQPKKFEIPLYKGDPPNPIKFDKAGAVIIGCNIHDWMKAYIYVVGTPYFAKTDATGKISITNMPTGSYKVKLWHPLQKSRRAMSESIQWDDSKSADLEFSMELKPEWGPRRAPTSRSGVYR